MKRIVIIALFLGFGLHPIPVKAQVQEAVQLALNIQKLNQLRKILQNMYQGYQILVNGYNRVKDIAEGNFKLHDVFLDGLLQVSPTVRQYKKVVEIVSVQKRILQTTQQLLQQSRGTGTFSLEEVEYLGAVLGRLGKESLQQLDALLMVLTARQLRMTDAERLETIDRIHHSVMEQFTFLQVFAKEAQVIVHQRARLHQSQQRVANWHGIERSK